MTRRVSKHGSTRCRSFAICFLAFIGLVASSLSGASGTGASSTGRGKVPSLGIARRSLDPVGDVAMTSALRSGDARGRALATADLDRDGAPDLVAGYSYDGIGIVTVQRGNPDAFAPKDAAVFARMQKGYNPDSLLTDAESYQTPEPVDFLCAGDFTPDAQKDVLVAAQGGGLYLMTGDGNGRLNEPKQIILPGRVTAMASGEFGTADGRTDVAVGISGPGGPALLIFREPSGVIDSTALTFPLESEAAAIQFGGLDDDPFIDVAVAAASEIEIIHGWGRATSPTLQSRVERIPLGFEAHGLAVGYFIRNRRAATQVAALADDGMIRILQRGTLDARQFDDAEIAERARARLRQNREPVDVESAPGWQPNQEAPWSIARSIGGGIVPTTDSVSQYALVKSHTSFRESDDLLLLSESARVLKIIRQAYSSEEQSAALTVDGDMGILGLDLGNAPAAVVALPPKLNGERDIVLLDATKASLTVAAIMGPMITVDRMDDTAAASACTGAPNDCSLRGAVQFANVLANAGTTISLPAGTYTLNINGAGGCVIENAATGNTIGDLEINQSTAILGSGSASTIIRQLGIGGGGFTGDRVMCLNVPIAAGIEYVFSGFTVTGGRESSGVGGAGIVGGAKDNTLSLTDVTISNNRDTALANYSGGGLSITGGSVTITNCLIGGTNPPGTNRSDVTLANSAGPDPLVDPSGGPGGGLGYSPGDPNGATPSVGTLTITGTTIQHNTAASTASGGGGADLFTHNLGTGSVSISTSMFANNQALGLNSKGSGGAIAVESIATTVASTSFTSNTATSLGGGIYVAGGSLLLDGTSPSITFASNTATNGASSVGANSTVNVSGTNTNIGGDVAVFTNGTWTNNAGSTLSPTNFTILGGTLTCNNSVMNVGGNLVIGHEATKGGILNANTATINIQGNLNVDLSNGGSGALGQFNAGTSTFNFNGSGAQSINGPSSPTFSTLNVNKGGGTLTLNINTPVTANLSVIAGIFDLGIFTANRTAAGGALTVSNGATLKIGGSNSLPTNFASIVLGPTSTVEFEGTGSQTINAVNYGNLVSSSTGARTLVNGITTGIAGSFTPGNNAYATTGSTVDFNGAGGQSVPAFNFNNLTISGARSGATVTLASGTIGVAGIFNPAATSVVYSTVGNTVNFNGTGAQSVPAFNFNGLTISGARTTNNVTLLNGGTIGIAGAFSPTATFTTGGFVVTNNTIDFNGIGAQTVASFNYNNLSITGPRTTNNVTLVNGGTIGVAGVFNPSATFTSGGFVVTNNTFNFNGTGAQNIPAFNFGNLTISNTRTTNSVTLINGGTIRIAGTFNPTATFTTGAYVITGNIFEYNGSGSSQTLPSGFTPYNNLILNNPAGTTGFAGLTVQELIEVKAGTFTSSSTYKDVQIDAGATLAGMNSTTINVSGNWTNDGSFTPNGNTVNFNGNNSTQTISGGSITSFDNLTINHTGSGGISLSNSVGVNAVLTLTSSNITTNANTVSVGPTGSRSRTSGHIIGNEKKSFGAPGSFVFDVGTANGYSPVDTMVTAGTGDLTVVAVQGAQPSVAACGSLLRYWSLTEGGAGLTANLVFHYLDPTDIGGTEANYQIIRILGGIPTYFANNCPSAPCVDTVANTATITGVTDFSDWTLGAPILGAVSGGETICTGSSSNVVVDVSGGTPPYTVKLTNNSEVQTGGVAQTHFTFSVTPTLTTMYQVDSTASQDANACVIAGSGSATVTVNQPPTTATVGGNQTMCALGTTGSLGGNTPTVGTGTWSVVSGGTGTFAPNENAPDATFTHTSGTGPIVLQWTISNPPCTDSTAQLTVSVNQPPTAATVGGPQTICALGTTAGLGGNAPTVGTGTWSVVSGGAGTFSPDENTPNATFTHTSGTGPILLRWTISSPPCPDSTADVTITVNQGPSPAMVGSPQTICALGTTAGLGGNTPSVGSGTWSVVSGGTGTFSDVHDPNATFTHTGGTGPIVLRWTISNPPCTTDSSADVTITISQPPSVATVGPAQTICALGTTASLGGNTPTAGLGTWSVLSGGTGTFSNDHDPSATFTHTGGTGPVNLVWTISNPPCAPDSTATVTVTINQPPSPASVGMGQAICPLGTTSSLGGNAPAVGVGTWSVVSGGAGTFNNVHAPGATFTHTSGAGPIALRWTISNPPCPDSSAEVTVTINQQPSITMNPASQFVVPGGTATFTASANGSPTPTVQWQTSTDGGGTFNNIPGATNVMLSFTVSVSQNLSQYRAVFTNSCGSATTTAATLTVDQPPIAKCKNVTVPAGSACTADASIDNGSSDPDSGDSITLSQSPPGPYQLGITMVTLTVTDNHGASSQCSSTVTVVDTTPPSITCPDNKVVSVPNGQACVVVVYPTPAASDNCGASVVCVPPSGTCFPSGSTTVTCTATDTSNNNTSCSFTVSTFNLCIQNDGGGPTMQFDSMSGQYSFRCGATTYTGKGTVQKSGNIVALTDYASDRRVVARVDLATKTASASLQSPPGVVKCSISDRNITNNACSTP
jgi:HYR domain